MKDYISHITRLSGLAALAVGFSAVALSMYREGLDIVSYRPLSYLGTTDSARLFGSGLIIGAALMIPFYTFLAKHYRLSVGFKLSLAVLLASLAVIALTRDEIQGRTNMVHWYAVWSFTISRILTLIFFTWHNQRLFAGRVSRAAGFILLLALGPELMLSAFDVVTDTSQLLNMAVYGVWIVSAAVAVPAPRRPRAEKNEKNLTRLATQAR